MRGHRAREQGQLVAVQAPVWKMAWQKLFRHFLPPLRWINTAAVSSKHLTAGTTAFDIATNSTISWRLG